LVSDIKGKHKLKVYENSTALRRIFELKRDEMEGGWRKLLNGELHKLCSSPHIQ
jgi:hypothetical protein